MYVTIHVAHDYTTCKQCGRILFYDMIYTDQYLDHNSEIS